MVTAFHPGFTSLYRPAAPRRAGAMAAVALHGLAAAALASYEPARSLMLDAAPIMVELISAPQIQSAPQPHPEPPKSRAVAKPETNQAPLPFVPLVAAATESATPPAVAAAAPATVAGSRTAQSHEPAAAVPAPFTPPVFDAAYLENPAPAYPSLSRRLREEGRVLLRVLVTPAGAAEEVQVRTSSGASRLDAAALETVRRWKFIPARRGAETFPAWVLIPISFKLES